MVRRSRQSALGGLAVAAALLAATACSVSDEREIALGRANAEQVETRMRVVTDSVIAGYVQDLGMRLAARTSRAALPWHFSVIDSKDVNAFALPGGFIYVNRGLIERADHMDELAGALGHEIGHVVRRHSVQQLKRTGGTRVGVVLFCAITSLCDSRAARIAIDVGGAAWLARNSRSAEAEADSEAVANTTRAGISPEGIPALFRALLAARKTQPGMLQEFFASHPLEEDRIDQTQRLVDRVDPAIERTLERDEQAFRDVKRRLEALP
jgi:predicted Zn-dependent protease